MNRYVTTITNTRGDSLPGFQARVLSSTGTIVDIFQDASGTAWPNDIAVADDEGVVSFFWTAAAGQTLQFLDSTGAFTGRAIANFAENQNLANCFGTLADSAVPGIANKANASAVGISGSASNLGTFASDLIDDNQTVKGALISLAARLLSSAGAGFIGYTGLRLGAAYRTVLAKLNDWDTVKDFGAIGDEVANDFEAFEKAIAGVPSGATIFVPPGRYYMSSAAQTLLVDRDISLVGAGEGASVLIFEHSVPGTDAITIGNVDETRVGIRIEYIGIQFKNGNTRDVIRTESFMSKFTLNHLDIRSYNTSFAFRASGAAIRIGGVGTVGGLNDWLLIQHCYLALCTYGIVATGRNTINARITQNTTASITFESLFWTTGGQSQIDNNTFQYSNLGADGSRKFYTVVFDGGSPSDVNNITFGPGNSFQANGGAGLGPAVIKTWEMLVKDCTSINIVGNQFAGAANSSSFGAYHAIEFINSSGWVEKNTWEGYSATATGDNDPGPCQYDSASRVSHVNNINGDFTLGAPDFTTASSTAALVTVMSGSLRLEQKSTSPFFNADAVSGIIDMAFLRIGGSDKQITLNQASGQAQMGGGTATISLSWCNPSTIILVSLTTNAAPKGYVYVHSVNNGNFVVKSEDPTSNEYFYWSAKNVA
ncbi:glycosyl hydrolase family 28-related protein [Novosphingobium sp.]|uniref:glycosyl hydrolase family 28-related protein n=1 Tax=Novosphingobium sp. TaxID=1874826 RepID=UPI00356B482E